MSLPRVAVICDFVEEGWPSMDLVGEMLVGNLRARHGGFLRAATVRPRLRHRFGWLPGFREQRFFLNVDRLLNRFWDYPRFLQEIQASFELFHIVDHSYAQLVHHLPHHRTIVTCHDLDTFRCLLEPARERRSRWFRQMAGRIWGGLCRAARIICDSRSTRQELLSHWPFSPERVVMVPLGVHSTCSPEADPLADGQAARLLGPVKADALELLHVGSTVARKRIDILLRIFAEVRNQFSQARLIRVGGAFTKSQVALVDQLRLGDSVVVLPFLDRAVLASVYRRAALVLQPSQAEGFGLPVVEAMACGTPVVATDVPVLREVGGEAATYCPVADVRAWSQSVSGLVGERRERPDRWAARRSAGIARAAQFSWEAATQKMVEVYREVLNGSGG